jgi:DNA polymerase-4
MGINTIGELSVLPIDALKSRFGAFGEALHYLANGIDDREVQFTPVEAKSISRETTFAKDTRGLAFLESALHYLSERVGAELREQGKQAKCVHMKLRYADFTTIIRSHTLRQTTESDRVIFEAGVRLMKRELLLDRQLVRLIGIGVSDLTRSGEQLNMLDSSACRQAQINRVMDRIRKKYGFTIIQTGRTLPLRGLFPETDDGYILQTPSLSR